MKQWEPRIGMKVRITKDHCIAHGKVREIGIITEIRSVDSFRVKTKTAAFANWRCRECVTPITIKPKEKHGAK